MLTLYTMPDTCALAPNIATAWLDAPIAIHNLSRGEQKKPAYLAINPKGKVPALRFDDGDVLTEAAAILDYIGAEYGKDRFARDVPLGRKESEALAYMTSEVHAAYGPHFAVESFADTKAAQEEIKRAAYKTLAEHYGRMNAQLARSGDWFLEQRSFADAYLYVLGRWLDQTPMSIVDYPAIKRHRTRMEGDEGVRSALARQGMQPLG